MVRLPLSLLPHSPSSLPTNHFIIILLILILILKKELITKPSILLLDEPTSGLDAKSSRMIIETLQKLADHGNTVITTIHQPSSQVCFFFVFVCLLFFCFCFCFVLFFLFCFLFCFCFFSFLIFLCFSFSFFRFLKCLTK